MGLWVKLYDENCFRVNAMFAKLASHPSSTTRKGNNKTRLWSIRWAITQTPTQLLLDERNGRIEARMKDIQHGRDMSSSNSQ